MRILGIDWGEKKIGLAISETSFAEPFGVVGSFDELKEIIEKEGVGKVVLGLPEGKHQEKVKELGGRIEKELNVPVTFRSEVLTTRQVLEKAIEAGKPQKSRRDLNALSATLILQEYLDESDSFF